MEAHCVFAPYSGTKTTHTRDTQRHGLIRDQSIDVVKTTFPQCSNRTGIPPFGKNKDTQGRGSPLKSCRSYGQTIATLAASTTQGKEEAHLGHHDLICVFVGTL